MYIHEGYFLGDAWYYVDVDTDAVHMFYLAWPDGDRGRIIVGHAVSQDLVQWEPLPPALQPGPAGSWDDLTLCTGSTIKREGRYWMAYAATSRTDSSEEEPFRVQRTGMAVSDDLIAWHRLPENPQTQSGPPHYEGIGSGERKMAHWRDPFLFDYEGSVYQFVCARRSDGEVAARGTVALTKSSEMRHWEILAPLEHDRIADEMEVPQVYQINGRWYLVFCTLGRFLAPGFRDRFKGPIPERSNFAMVGSSPFGPFHIHGTGQIVQHPPDAIFYAAQLVCFRRKWYLLATAEDEVSRRISDPLPVYGDETGVHECS